MTALRRLRSTAYGRLHNLSLTARLVAVVVVMVLAAFAVTTAITASLLRDYLTSRIDDELATNLSPLSRQAYTRLYGMQSTEFVLPNPYVVVLTDRRTDREYHFQTTLTPRGRALEVQGLSWDDPRVGAGPFTARTDAGDWRVLAEQLPTEDATVAVALPMTSVDNTVGRLWLLTSVVGLVTLVSVALLSWFAVRRAFRPLQRIEDTARAIAAGDLARRVPPREATDEVASLSDSLNVMLSRIEQAFAVRQASEQRMRQFVADASHELRTPLATVRGYAELYRVGGITDPADVGSAMRRIEDEAGRMSTLVEDLLMLTRWDSERASEEGPVDLTVLAADTVQDARVRTPGRDVRLVPLGPGGPAAVVVGHDAALRQVLTNLVANALAHTPDGTPIEVAVGSRDGQAVVEVRDHGPGIPPEAAERVFERFYRADPSRTRASGGTGLGLAIVAAIVARHDGTVRHLPTPGGGATFRVALPLAGPDAHAAEAAGAEPPEAD